MPVVIKQCDKMDICHRVAGRIKRIIVKHLEQCLAQNQCYMHVYDASYMPKRKVMPWGP